MTQQTTYQIILSTDGKHTVIVAGEDPATLKAGLEWAKITYDQLVARYGLKHEQYHRNGEANGQEAVPTCAVHGVPMVRQTGRYGEFWSCHERNADGSFCSFRPEGR